MMEANEKFELINSVICNSGNECSNFTQNVSGICDECTKEINPNSKQQNYNTTIDSFFEHISGLDEFLKSMRPMGFFGMSPQNQSDLDQQQEMISRLQEIKEFVELNYQKNKDLINQ